MPAKTDFNVSPYWDDFNIDNDFYRVLFRPGFAVQARELTTLQTILQNQIEQFGNHVFKEGSIVIPGSVGYDSSYYALKLQPSYLSGTVSTYLSQYLGATLTGVTSGVTAKVINFTVADSTTGDPDTLFIKYITTSTADNATMVFTDGENISADKIISSYAADVASSTAYASAATATGAAVTVQAGIYYIRGFMVQNLEQTIILDKYTNTPSYRVGWNVTESLITPEEDASLLDNAQGSSNYAAKGAHRFKMTVALAKKTLTTTDDSNFVELARLNAGRIENRIKFTEYSVVADMLARRTDDESGDYIVKHFDIDPRESLDNGTNRGVYTAAQGGDETKDVLIISPGKAYVDGYELDLQNSQYINIDKARTTKNIQNDSVPADLGNYAQVANVYGEPDITEVGASIDPFKFVKLYDQQTVTRGSSAGSNIGYARSRSFEYNSGTIGTHTGATKAIFHHYLFDVSMFNTIDVAGAHTLTTNAVVTGKTSKATGIVVAGISAAAQFQVMQQVGQFQLNEALESSVTTDVTPTGNQILATTNSTANQKTFARDVKQIYSDNTGLDYTSDMNLSESTTLGGTVTWTTGTTVNGLNTTFTTDLVVGDIISLPTGGAGVQEERRVTQVNTDTTLVVASVFSNAVTSVNVARLRGKVTQEEETVLLYKLPKDNVKTLLDAGGATDTSYSYRKQFTGTTNASSVVTFTLSAGHTWAAPSVARNYTMVVTAVASGSASVGDVVSITGTGVASGQTLTVTDVPVLGANTVVELIGTVNFATATQRSKTANKMTEKQIQSFVTAGASPPNGGTYKEVYGERLGDAEISLSYADVYKLHAVYESVNNTTDAVTPTLTLSNSTGTFTVGELITGSASGATGRIISTTGSPVVAKYVKIVGTFTTLDTITGGTSGFTAGITAITNGDQNVTSNFLLDTGQRDSFYDIGRIARKPNAQLPTGRLLVIYDYFSHGTGDYFSVDSYTGQVTYADIPKYTASRVDPDSRAPIGEYELRDVFDFRPRVKNQIQNAALITGKNPFSFINKNFEDTGSVNGNLVAPDDNITMDFDFYLSRKDLLYLNRSGEWSIVKGVPAEAPTWPATDNIGMLVCKLSISAYTFEPDKIDVAYLNNKGYTMKDIGKLETRIGKLEYTTTLAMLERETDSYMILDGDGLNRFKSGFIVDNFYGHNIGNVTHPDYHCAVDPGVGVLRPVGVQTGVNLIEENTSDAARLSDGYTKTGDLIMLPYTETDHTVQPYASRVESVNPYSVTEWIGDLILQPETDVWMDDDRIPSITINVEGNYEQLLREQTEAGTLGTIWNSWNTTWTGNSTTTVNVTSEHLGLIWDPNRGTTTTTTDIRQERRGMDTRLVERIDNISAGDRVTNIEIVPWMRSRDVNFTVTGMKPNTRVYAFFDGTNVNADVKPTLTSASSTTLSVNLAKADSTTITVASTAGFPTSGTIALGDMNEVDPFGIGFIKQEQVTYTGKTATTFTGLTRNTGNQYDEPQNWLATTPVDDATYGNQLVTDDVGTLYGRFKIPNTDTKRFRIGRKTFRLTDSSSNSQTVGFVNTSAEKEYMALGHKQTKQELIMATRNASITQIPLQEERQTTVTSTTAGGGGWYDPLAQTIMCDQVGGMFATSVDIFFSHKAASLPVWVEMRSVINGYPSQEILPFSVKSLQPADVNVNTVDGTTATKFTFDSPVYLRENMEYAVVVASDTPDYKIWISRLGEIDKGGTRAISTQPTLGSLFKSQNATTWTASQFEDMKFTLRRAKFTIGSGSEFTMVNEAFTEADINGGGGNGLIPVLANNPIEAVSGQSKVKVNFVNHANYDVDSNVEIKGAISDVGNTALNGTISSAATTITCDDVTNFPQTGTNTIRIDNELITYTGTTGTTQLTGCVRGTVNGDGVATTAAAHDDNSIVYLYMLGGVPLIEINKIHTAVADIELDSFTIATTTAATTTVTAGGTNIHATKNVSYDVIQPIVQTMELPYTSITAKLQSTTGSTVGSTQNAYQRLSTATALSLPLNEDFYYDAPQIICSPINETNELSGNKSFRLSATLTSTKDNVSPIIDTQRMLACCVSSRLNEIDASTDINTTFTNYKASTESTGDNNRAIYITKKITLKSAATALKVYIDAVQMSEADIVVLYKLQRIDTAEPFEDLGWTFFTGAGGTADGRPDPTVATSKSRQDFREYQYLAGKAVNGTGTALDEFNAFAIKIVMQGKNSSLPPLIKDFRAIALAT